MGFICTSLSRPQSPNQDSDFLEILIRGISTNSAQYGLGRIEVGDHQAGSRRPVFKGAFHLCDVQGKVLKLSGARNDLENIEDLLLLEHVLYGERGDLRQKPAHQCPFAVL